MNVFIFTILINDIINSKNPKNFLFFNYNTHYNKYAYNFFAKNNVIDK